ncbi:MAG: glycosyltransferase [Actinomycetes bacterium]|jgi:glycosyltransferase involved in cell wall biosynthesis|nr:glycosyltransferase [Actinomycetes bacterium]
MDKRGDETVRSEYVHSCTISVVMPVWNPGAYLEDALASVCAQTFEDFELLLTDDGNDEATHSQLQAFVAAEPRARLISQEHAGRAAARNAGVAAARGRWLAFVDADDLVAPRYLQAQLESALRTKADCVVCAYERFDTATGARLTLHDEGSAALYGTDIRHRPDILLAMDASLCNHLYARHLFFDNDGDSEMPAERVPVSPALIFPPGNDFEDLAVAYCLALRAHRIEKVDELLYRYRDAGPASVMAACDERYLQIPQALGCMVDYFDACAVEPDVRDNLAALCFIHLLSGRLDDFFVQATAALRTRFIAMAFEFLNVRFPGWRHLSSVRKVCPRWVKRMVLTHPTLLRLYVWMS